MSNILNVGYLKDNKYYAGDYIESSVYKNFDNFFNRKGVCLIAETTFEYHDNDCEGDVYFITEHQGEKYGYTYEDLMRISNNNFFTALQMLEEIRWEIPENYLDQNWNDEDYFVCPKCGGLINLWGNSACETCNSFYDDEFELKQSPLFDKNIQLTVDKDKVCYKLFDSDDLTKTIEKYTMNDIEKLCSNSELIGYINERGVAITKQLLALLTFKYANCNGMQDALKQIESNKNAYELL